MAEEGEKKRATFEDAVLTIIGILVVMQILSNISERVDSFLGGDDTTVTAQTVEVLPLTARTPPGTLVRTPRDATLTAYAGSSRSVGSMPEGARATIVGGPEAVDGERWWQVSADTNNDGTPDTVGWLRESELEGVHDLARDSADEREIPLSQRTPLGTLVRAQTATPLASTPGGRDTVATMPRDVQATIVGGPETVGNERWWQVSADTNADGTLDSVGWVPEDALRGVALVPQESTTSDGAWGRLSGKAILGANTPLGTSVRFTQLADIFSRPAGGAVLGVIPQDREGVLVGGPERVGSDRWWQVDTDSYETGWVAERTLESASSLKIVHLGFVTLIILGAGISIVFLFGLAYVTLRTNQIRAGEARIIKAASQAEGTVERNERWEAILRDVSSENPNDWRQAIIEADIILDELVTKMGYRGETLGDKLKQIERSDFNTLDEAWQAHKVRNRIAHSGSDYILTQREARRVIELFREVFHEFRYI